MQQSVYTEQQMLSGIYSELRNGIAEQRDCWEDAYGGGGSFSNTLKECHIVWL